MNSENIQYLYGLRNEYQSLRYDLRNIQILSNELDDPHQNFSSALIAGTNGKGSVAQWLAAMVKDSGLYTSPHLVNLNERVVVGGEVISDDSLDEAFTVVREAAGRAKPRLLYPLTYFELVTAMAFTVFKSRVKYAVLEVGLGGRLDATNVVRQDLSVITNVARDHVEQLGETLPEIAAEKAGIIKEHEPVVVGLGANFKCIRERAGERLIEAAESEVEVRSVGSGYFEIDVTTPTRFYEALRPKLIGRHQIDNLLVAIRAAECLESKGWPIDKRGIVSAVNNAKWPGRLERMAGDPSFLLDSAHNASAIAALARFLGEFYSAGVWLVFGAMNGKDYSVMVELIREHASQIIFTRSKSPRSIDPKELKGMVPGSLVKDSIDEAISYAQKRAPKGTTVVVTGSLFLVGEARSILRFEGEESSSKDMFLS